MYLILLSAIISLTIIRTLQGKVLKYRTLYTCHYLLEATPDKTLEIISTEPKSSSTNNVINLFYFPANVRNRIVNFEKYTLYFRINRWKPGSKWSMQIMMFKHLASSLTCVMLMPNGKFITIYKLQTFLDLRCLQSSY